MAKFQIFTDSCSELSTELREKNNIKYCAMGLVVDGVEKKADLDWKEYSQKEFYNWMREGRKIKTTQVSYKEFIEDFTPVLEKGMDVLYLACSSALTASLSAMQLAKEELQKQFPDRRIEGIDTLVSSAILGMLVLDAADRQQKGASLDEVMKWVEDNKMRYNQFATVDTLDYLRNAGRIKGAKAFMGNLFHKKPIFISDTKGNNYTIMTVTGEKNADNELIKGIVETINKDECSRVVIAHGDDEERALRLKQRIIDELDIEPEIWWIGPIVGTTCGPGVIATFCFGKEVTRYEGEPTK